ncbi:FecR family protein [Sesbania bispinosa]|nr:FecR family protein [Sesbania bispinosa]
MPHPFCFYQWCGLAGLAAFQMKDLSRRMKHHDEENDNSEAFSSRERQQRYGQMCLGCVTGLQISEIFSTT